MDHHRNDRTTDAEIGTSLQRAREFDTFPTIVEAAYHPEPELQFLMLRLSSGQRLLIPREMLSELVNATEDQMIHLEIGPEGLDIWWPELDNGLYLPDFLEHRWRKQLQSLAA